MASFRGGSNQKKNKCGRIKKKSLHPAARRTVRLSFLVSRGAKRSNGSKQRRLLGGGQDQTLGRQGHNEKVRPTNREKYRDLEYFIKVRPLNDVSPNSRPFSWRRHQTRKKKCRSRRRCGCKEVEAQDQMRQQASRTRHSMVLA